MLYDVVHSNVGGSFHVCAVELPAKPWQRVVLREYFGVRSTLHEAMELVPARAKVRHVVNGKIIQEVRK